MEKSLLTTFCFFILFSFSVLAVSCGGGGGGAIAATGGNNKGTHFGSDTESGSKIQLTSDQLFAGETASMMATTAYDFIRLKVKVNGEEKTYQIQKSQNIELNIGTTIGDKLQMYAEICDASGNVLRTATSDPITVGLGKNNVVMYIIYKARLHHADGTVTEYPFTSLGSTLPADTSSYPTSGYAFNSWASESDGGGTLYNSIAPGTRNDVELYAYWTPVPALNVLSEPEITFTPSLTGKTDSDGYQLIEIPASQNSASCRIFSNEAGVSIFGKIDGVTFNGEYNGSLGVGSHTIDVTVSKENSRGVVISKKIKVVEELQKPTLQLFSNNAGISDTGDAEDSAYSSYGCYNITLTASGTGSLEYNVTPKNERDSVSVKVDNSSAGSSGTLGVGPHTITLSVSRPNYITKMFTEKVYVQGILSNPTITPTCTYSSGNDYEFSYLTYDKMPVSVSPGNTGNTVEVRVDGSTVSSDFELAPDASYTVEVIQRRQFCKTPAPFTKTMNVKIKPVTLSFNNHSGTGKLDVYLSGFSRDSFDLKGEIKVASNTVFHYESSKYGVSQNRWQNLNDSDLRSFSLTFTSPSDEIKVYMSDIRRNVGVGSDEQLGGGNKTKLLKDCKQEKSGGYWIFISDAITGNGRSIRPKISFTPSE